MKNRSNLGIFALTIFLMQAPSGAAVVMNPGGEPVVAMNVGVEPEPIHVVPMHPLHTAARQGTTDDIEAILDNVGIDVNIRGPFGMTPFLYAVCRGNEEIMSYLHDMGADITLTDHDGNGALHYAAMQGDYNTAAYLMNLGLDDNLNRSNNHDDSPLTFAVEFFVNANDKREAIGLIRLFLDGGALLNVLGVGQFYDALHQFIMVDHAEEEGEHQDYAAIRRHIDHYLGGNNNLVPGGEDMELE